VKVTFLLADRKYIPDYRRVRQEVLAGRKIALTTMITGIFDEQWLLEIEGIAPPDGSTPFCEDGRSHEIPCPGRGDRRRRCRVLSALPPDQGRVEKM